MRAILSLPSLVAVVALSAPAANAFTVRVADCYRLAGCSVDVAGMTVTEPTSLALLGLGLFGAGIATRKRR